MDSLMEEEIENGTSPADLGIDAEDPVINTKKKRIIWKNVFLVSLSFAINFMAFQSLQNAQSSLNAVNGLGVASLSVAYTCSVLTGIFLTPLIISRKGCKWNLVIFTFCYISFAAANFYPTWYTMIPASVIVGIAAGPLWTAKCTYLASSAYQYIAITRGERGPVMTHFFGIFQVVYLSGTILGNVLMSVILKPGGLEAAGALRHSCGAADCPSKTVWTATGNETTTARIASDESVYLLMGIFIGAIVVAGVIVLVLVDDVTNGKEKKNIKIKSQIYSVASMIYKDKRMLCLLPMNIYAGLYPGFVAVDFAKSYVTCAIGIQNLGYVLICFAFGQACFGAIIGKIEHYTGRRIIIFSGYIICIALFVLMLKWNANASSMYVFYLVSGAFGVVKCVWRTETNSLAGLFFPQNQETAFSVVRVCTSIGFLISFGWGYDLCVYMKIYIHIAFLTLAIVGYAIAEQLERKHVKNQMAENELDSQETHT